MGRDFRTQFKGQGFRSFGSGMSRDFRALEHSISNASVGCENIERGIVVFSSPPVGRTLSHNSNALRLDEAVQSMACANKKIGEGLQIKLRGN